MRIKREAREAQLPCERCLKPPWPLARLGTTDSLVRIDTGSGRRSFCHLFPSVVSSLRCRGKRKAQGKGRDSALSRKTCGERFEEKFSNCCQKAFVVSRSFVLSGSRRAIREVRTKPPFVHTRDDDLYPSRCV